MAATFVFSAAVSLALQPSTTLSHHLRVTAATPRAAPTTCSAVNTMRRRAALVGGLAAAVLPSARPVAASSLANMAGKTVIVTGGNSGLGLAAATQLAEAGATVVLACRDPAKGNAAKESIRQATQAGTIEVSALDLGDLSSVKSFKKSWGDRPIDVLMLNAGVMAIPERSFTTDGFERHFGVNHLGHFALTALLWPELKKAATGGAGGARVVVVSTDGHKKGSIAFDDINLAKPGAYKDCSTPFCTAYTQSKLANVLFANELERRIPKDVNVAVTSLSPGLVNTALARYALPDLKSDP